MNMTLFELLKDEPTLVIVRGVIADDLEAKFIDLLVTSQEANYTSVAKSLGITVARSKKLELHLLWKFRVEEERIVLAEKFKKAKKALIKSYELALSGLNHNLKDAELGNQTLRIQLDLAEGIEVDI